MLETWKSEKLSPFNWCTVLNVLTSPIIGERALAENIVKKLRKNPQVTGIDLTLFCILHITTPQF